MGYWKERSLAFHHPLVITDEVRDALRAYTARYDLWLGTCQQRDRVLHERELLDARLANLDARIHELQTLEDEAAADLFAIVELQLEDGERTEQKNEAASHG